MPVRAVVFDLWGTLAVWPEEQSAELRRAWSEALDIPVARIEELWFGEELYRVRETGPIASAVTALYEALGVHGDVEETIARRTELTRGALVPVPGALETLRALRQRGIATGLVSNCTEEVALVWDETPFASLFDAAVFSATAGCMKPDRQIYEHALSGLGVSASEALFVGDGANDELEGARRVGMTPVLVSRDGVPPWPAVADWSGHRVVAIPEVLELVA